METPLILANVGAISAVAAVMITGLLAWRKSTVQAIKWLLILVIVLTVAWNSFLVLALNVQSPQSALVFFRSTIIIIPLVAVIFHLLLLTFRTTVGGRSWLASLVYLGALLLMGLCFWRPDVYIGDVKPFDSLTHILQPGPYLWLMVIYLGLVITAALVLLIIAAVRSWQEGSVNTRDKAFYCLLALVLMGAFLLGGYLFSYNWPFGLVLMAWLGWAVVFLSYGTVKFKVFSFWWFLKYTGFYLTLVGLLSAVLIILTDISFQLRTDFPNFPWWLLPVIMVIALVAVGGTIWHRLREAELLKYEFVSIITHKFRTPLTRIKWSAGMLRSDSGQEDLEAAVSEIDYSVQKLVELTNLLVSARQIEGVNYRYNFMLHNLTNLVREVIDSVELRAKKKSLEMSFDYDSPYFKVEVDKQRLIYALQILFENAISYTPGGGRVEVRITRREDWVIFSITDSGIGLNGEEVNQIFSQFYRTTKAKLMDTEGAGVGLFMAREIVERHGGRIWAESPGPNRGTTFYIKLPVAE